MTSLKEILAVLAVLFLSAAGCESQSGSAKQGAPADGAPAEAEGGAAGTEGGAAASEAAPGPTHDHGTGEHAGEGPHHGSLVELGDEEYHAEVVHDLKNNTVTIYLLDGSAAKAVSIPDMALTVNIKIGGKPKVAKLPAKPVAGDPAGQSSRFALKNAGFSAALDGEDAGAVLSVTIRGKTYRAALEHSHEGHEHEEGEEANHGHSHSHD